MKYLLCILSLAFLFVGVGQFSNDDNLLEFRRDVGVPVYSVSLGTDSRTDSFSQADFFSFSLYALSLTENAVSTSGFRNTAPVRILKFNDIPTIVFLLSSRAFHLPEHTRKTSFSDINYLRYSTHYYIYTLSHLLI